ncbi:right-handed parallel beta-helix repeat-containing protein [Tamlana sp. 2_MG-2023]|uniref:right-handed parallel beta-helix repeat-containing protein n=1 Tax=unclassified Tamlana TaxID=2614803 RepID=UPI0026E2B159|nr:MULTISPECIES: right-handed parallel beta-helix repeat-containing protein [unclassified Tamlana]MDO6759464.1 right-handed parallel beta-helix repeat-containing protein [Tamlana sp. 2_MG-2023]MDO6790397.1 right-handed parallel beta-helix repeat-containing protein [Tamlana sp. 1_MG-2023]
MKNRILLLLLLLFIMLTQALSATEYYVSKNGADSNNGSINNPFKTIQKAADIMVSGDICYIKRGVYREQVTVKTNNITFINFENDKVVITGADLVTGWVVSSQGARIYETNFTGSESDYTMLFIDGERQGMARWPNNLGDEMMMPEDKTTGYEDCQVFTGVEGQKSRQVKFPNMSGFADDFFKGGIFRGINGKKWINPMGTITASSGINLTVDAITDGWIDNSEKIFTDSGKGFGFIFHLNALDREGEWFQTNNKIYLMPPAGKNPNDLQISIKNRKWGFVLNNRNNITIKGISIHAASINMDNTDNARIEDCSIQYLQSFLTRSGYGVSKLQGGVYVNGDNNTIKNCYVAHSWGHGIYVDGGNNNKIEGTRIEDIGWIAQFTSSLQNYADGTIVTNSTFGSTGRFHIRTNGQINITYNDLYDCMKMGQDAGSIQCTNGSDWGVPLDMKGSEIAYNRIHDSNTLTDGKKEFVLALYLEGCYNYTVHHNLIYNFITDEVPDGTFAYLGPRKAKITDCFYYNNTVWNVDWAVRVWNRDNEGDVENIHFWNNIIDSRAAYQETKNTTSLFALMDFSNNYEDVTGTGNTIFEDAPNGDFRLKSGVAPINYGKIIPGVTDGFSGHAPDAGAIEYGSDFPAVGSTVNKSIFDGGDYLTEAGNENIVPAISFLNPPTEYEQALIIPVEINYNSDKENELVAVMHAPNGTWLGNTRITVQAGKNQKASLGIKLSEIPKQATNYKITISIRPVKGNAASSYASEFNLVTIKANTLHVEPIKVNERIIFPNPAQNQLNFSKKEAWVIKNITGEIVLSGSTGSADISTLSNGIYLVYQNGIIFKLVKK